MTTSKKNTRPLGATEAITIDREEAARLARQWQQVDVRSASRVELETACADLLRAGVRLTARLCIPGKTLLQQLTDELARRAAHQQQEPVAPRRLLGGPYSTAFHAVVAGHAPKPHSIYA
jgi:hypothetical protein